MPDPNLGADGFPRSDYKPPDTGVQLAPGGLAAAQAAGYAPPDPSSAPAFDPAPAPKAPAVPFVPDPLPASPHAPAVSRRAVKLEYPFPLDGRIWDTIYVRRFTAEQVATVLRNWRGAQETDPEAPLLFPSFVDADGSEIPSEVMRALDQDDMETVQSEAQKSLPRGFRRASEPTANDSGPNSGAPTAP